LLNEQLTQIVSIINFFLLSIALTFLFIHAYRLKYALKNSEFHRRRAESFQSLFNATSEGVFRSREDGTLLEINDSGVKLLGLPSSKISNGDAVNIFECLDNSKGKKELLALLSHGQDVHHMVFDLATESRCGSFIEMSVHKRMDHEPVLEGIFYDITERIHVEENLRAYKTNLERDVTARTRDLILANKKIAKQHTELQKLSTSLIKSQETERRRIAQELHDELGQSLTAVKIGLEIIEDRLRVEKVRGVKEILSESISVVGNIMDNVHQISLNLRPSMLDELGLLPTVEWFTNTFSRRVSIPVRILNRGFKERLPSDQETILYRVVQEALTNVAKHAKADEVRMIFRKVRMKVQLWVIDNGSGFNLRTVKAEKHLKNRVGLIGIREKMVSCGGRFFIHSEPRRGTRLMVELDLP
jgi:PAS domain S-box-containing protein